jgi:hypothetical protein
MTSNQHALYVLGDTRATMAGTKRCDRESKQIAQSRSQFGLKSAIRLHVKAELLVIADQHAAVNTFPGFVHTARQTMRAGNA